MTDLCNALHHKASKKDRTIFMKPETVINVNAVRPCVKRYYSMKKDYMEIHKMPGNIHVDFLPCNTMLFEDSIYNF